MSFNSRYLAPPTPDEQRRQDQARALGCRACLQLGLPLSEHCGAIEYHHRLSGGVTVGHRWGYALGRWHHQGIAKRSRSLDWMLAKYGPNLKDNKGGFHGTFGSDQALQNDQDDALGVAREDMPSPREIRAAGNPTRRKPSRCERPSKIFPRPPSGFAR